MSGAGDTSRGCYPVAVLGGGGYLGRNLCSALAEAGKPFWVVGRQSLRFPPESPHPYRSSVPDLRAAIEGASTVIHFATVTTPAIGETNPYLDLENIRLTLDLIAACEKSGVRHVVFSSSGGTIYGDTHGEPASEETPPRPGCSYAIAKLACEQHLWSMAQRGSCQVTALRVSNPYGGSQRMKGEQGVLAFLMAHISLGEPVVLLGDTVRDYVHVEDVVRAFRMAVENPPRGYLVLNISTGVGTRLRRLAEETFRLFGVEPRIEIASRRPFDLAYNVLRNDRAREVLDWSPAVGLEQGLARAVADWSG